MDRILLNSEWFEQLAPGAQYEDDFQNSLVAHSAKIFPTWHLIKFNKAIKSNEFKHGPKIPDFVLIDKKYRDWRVVEVEMSHHSLRSHVLPQIETFAFGIYGEAHYQNILENCPELDPSLLLTLISTIQPKVLTIVNREVDDWVKELRGLSDIILVIPYINKHGRTGYRMVGNEPLVESRVISVCTKAPTMTGINIETPGALAKLKNGHILNIQCNGGSSQWKIHALGEHTFLFPVKGFPFKEVFTEFHLEIGDNGKLFLLPKSANKRRNK